MKLVFYSGGDEENNLKIDNVLIQLLPKKNPVFTFIPSSSFLSDQEFKFFVRHYSKFNIKKFIHFPVDVPFDQVFFHEVMKSDAIYLAGGNTFYFLDTLKKSGLIKHLKNFVKNGGILLGYSAGAIIMTENILTAAYPSFDRDENDSGIKDLRALNLVNFLFFPHFKNSLRYDLALKKISRMKNKVVIACPDGSGLVVQDNEIRFLGKSFVFFEGKKLILSSG